MATKALVPVYNSSADAVWAYIRSPGGGVLLTKIPNDMVSKIKLDAFVTPSGVNPIGKIDPSSYKGVGDIQSASASASSDDDDEDDIDTGDDGDDGDMDGDGEDGEDGDESEPLKLLGVDVNGYAVYQTKDGPMSALAVSAAGLNLGSWDPDANGYWPELAWSDMDGYGEPDDMIELNDDGVWELDNMPEPNHDELPDLGLEIPKAGAKVIKPK